MTSTLTSIVGTGLEPLPCADTGYRLPAVPERLTPATLMRERLRRWSLVHRAPSFAELAEVRAGRLGEQNTQRWTRRHLTMTIGTVFGGKRVPRDASAASMGRYEIDLLVITPRRVVALETKNWSGRLHLDGDRWVHERFGGEVRVYEDLIAYNRNKLFAVREYLRHCGVSLPPERFHQALIFDNPRLKLDPRDFGPHCRALRQCGERAGSVGTLARHDDAESTRRGLRGGGEAAHLGSDHAARWARVAG
jgi:Nuclease-related domain